MSNKNILQEYCQKNKLDMPIYTSRSDGPAHQLNWYCKIKVSDIEIETPNPSNSKTNAEQSVAKLALDQIKSNLKTNLKTNPTIESDIINSVFLIDLENKATLRMSFLKTYPCPLLEGKTPSPMRKIEARK